ncbi:hypothetical protein HQN89_26550 [Paenibacillus frigoriresistens]|uniref:hypothetical protein n=1 Tax=Paenibacillus alginolyticus TaxID=59839 RepID=UPI0015678D98|nr:hypothetical protein [Paenibacillus frigoriresistens]NRF94474.1 hypothetical protein [Paenibacillus frigoriresistens]
MEQEDYIAEATFHANISYLIQAQTKKQALEQVAYELDQTNIQLNEITFENELGDSHVFTVQEVEKMDWYDVNHTEWCNQFRVFGRMQLLITLRKQSDTMKDVEQSTYHLFQSLVYGKPVLTISEGYKHIFLTVSQHKMEWKTKLQETEKEKKTETILLSKLA